MAKDKKTTPETAEGLDDTKSTKKAKKAKDEPQKPNVFQRIGKWFRDLRIEFKNVTWPTRKTVLTNTSVVLTVIVIGSVVIGLLDSGLLKLAQFLIGLSQGGQG